MSKLLKSFILASLVGALLTPPVIARTRTTNSHSFVRRVAVATESLPLGDNPPPSGACFTREEIDTINSIVTSERVCRLSLIECRADRVKKVGTGWATWEIVMLTAGVGVLAAAAGVAVGKFVF